MAEHPEGEAAAEAEEVAVLHLEAAVAAALAHASHHLRAVVEGSRHKGIAPSLVVEEAHAWVAVHTVLEVGIPSEVVAYRRKVVHTVLLHASAEVLHQVLGPVPA